MEIYYLYGGNDIFYILILIVSYSPFSEGMGAAFVFSRGQVTAGLIWT